MPFVKRDLASPAAAGEADQGLSSLIQALKSADADTRWAAARSLGGRAEAVAELAAALAAEQVPRVQEALMTALMRVGDPASIAALLPYIRSSDAALRAAALEALQPLPHALSPFMTTLLNDDDSDVRILSIELMRGMPAEEATRLLCDLLEREQHPNVCAAAVDVLSEVGTRDALPVLQACARRFADTPFLPFALSTAIARISDADV